MNSMNMEMTTFELVEAFYLRVMYSTEVVEFIFAFRSKNSILLFSLESFK